MSDWRWDVTYGVPQSVSLQVPQLVDSLLAAYTGGAPFFNALDESVRRKRYYRALVDAAIANYGIDSFAVSGGFGEHFSFWWDTEGRPEYGYGMPYEVRFPGGLRYIPPDSVVSPLSLEPAVPKGPYVFLDDSLYRGRTRHHIANYFERNGSKLVGTVVVYDGSKQPIPGVKSFYRYYDPARVRGFARAR